MNLCTPRRAVAVLLGSSLLLLTSACGDGHDEAAGGKTESTSVGATAISGRIEGGLRVLTIDATATAQHHRIYRGDYVRPELTTGAPFTIEIAALSVAKAFPVAAEAPPYFKVPDAGVYDFRIGDLAGVIEAVDYAAPAYREVSAREGAAFIANLEPLVLDVRTAGEYAGGHLAGAVLIPVQELQQRIGELAGRREQPVFVYCKSGNRSTVAAKLLIDAGFEQVSNLRRGIREWQQEGLPLVK